MPPSPEQMPVPASCAPRESAVFASCDSAPNDMSDTNNGMSRKSGWRAFGPMHTSVPTGNVVEQREARELRGHELDRRPSSGAVWRGTPIAATKPWWPTLSRPCSASSWMRITYGSSIVPCGSV